MTIMIIDDDDGDDNEADDANLHRAFRNHTLNSRLKSAFFNVAKNSSQV